MASTRTARQWLEIFKFSVYIATPIAATVYLGTGAYPYLERIIHNTSYIVYPPEGDQPPTSTYEVDKARQKRREELAQRRQEEK